MVAREPGESHADYELRRRDDRHRKSRCIKSSSSEEKTESQAAGSAAGSGLGAAASAAPVEIVGEEKEKEEKEKETAPEASPNRSRLRGQQHHLVARRPAMTVIGLPNPADERQTQTYQVRSSSRFRARSIRVAGTLSKAA